MYPSIYVKKRRDSRHWWRRMLSRKYRKPIIKKIIYIWFLSIATYLFTTLHLIPNDLLSVVWAILVVAIVIPGKSAEHIDKSAIDIEEKHWMIGADKKPESDKWEKQAIKAIKENLKAQRKTEKVR